MVGMADTKITSPRACAICAKPAVARYHPFCSARCADVDLNRWLSGVYAVPAEDQGEAEDGGPQSLDGETDGPRRSPGQAGDEPL